MSDEDELDLFARHNKSDGADKIIPFTRNVKATVAKRSNNGAKARRLGQRRLLGRDEQHSAGVNKKGSRNFDPSEDDESHSLDEQAKVRVEYPEFLQGGGGSKDEDEGRQSKPQNAKRLELFAVDDLSLSDDERSITPPRNAHFADHVLLQDTPARQHTMSTRSYQTGDLNEMRQAVVEHVGTHALQIPLKRFKDRLLPPLGSYFSGRVVREILRGLIEGGLVAENRRGVVLTDFSKEPKVRKEKEDTVLAPLAGIFQETCCLASEIVGCDEAGHFLAMVPNCQPFSGVSMKQRPDGSLLPISKKEYVDLINAPKGETDEAKLLRERLLRDMKLKGKHFTFHDILVPLEGKKRLSDRNDNVTKMLFHGQQLIAHDPCRQFVIGITIENTDMRLWCLSRTIPILSKAFNFSTEIEELIRIILSLSFACPEKLGLDPSIRLVRTRNNQQYDIEIGTHKYRTTGMISDVKAHALRSTGTRVWTGNMLPSGAQATVKDTWIEADRYTERTIYENILKDVGKKYGKLTQERVAQGLVTPIADWVVGLTVDIDTDFPNSELVPLMAPKEELGSPEYRGRGPPRIHDYDSGETSSIPSCPQRKQYRIAYKETGTPLYAVKRLSDAFLALRNSVETLQFIHSCAWVHRDISSGNLYFYGGRGLIGDLEYSRRKGQDTVAHEMFTGSIDYMANEVIERQYIFRQNSEQDIDPPPFAHNALHDLESVWWTAVHLVFFILDIDFDGSLENEKIQAKRLKRNNARKELFPGVNTAKKRQDFLIERCAFLDCLSWMPDSLKDIVEALNGARGSLVAQYNAFEKSFEELDCTKVHSTLILCFKTCERAAARVESRSGSTLVTTSFSKRDPSTTASDVDTEEIQDLDKYQDFLEPTENDPGASSGRKRKLGPDGSGSATRRKIEMDQPDFIQGSSNRSLSSRGSKKKTGGNKSQQRKR